MSPAVAGTEADQGIRKLVGNQLAQATHDLKVHSTVITIPLVAFMLIAKKPI